jgi:hypothetical protein
MGGSAGSDPRLIDRPTSAAVLDDDDPTVFPKLTDEPLALLAPYAHVRSILRVDRMIRWAGG